MARGFFHLPTPRSTKLAHQIPGGFGVVSTQVLHIGGKALVQPQVVPPVHGHQVAEPLSEKDVSWQAPVVPASPLAKRFPLQT